jgi:MFS family permease
MRYPAGVREPLEHRRFRLLFLAQCASFLGDAVFIVAIAFAVLEITGSAAALGTVLAVGGVALVATFLVSGVWADRLPRLRLMIASDLVRLCTQGTLAALLLTDHATFASLLVLNALYNVATAFFQPARTALTPQLLEPRLLLPGNGLMATAENVMWMLGWACGGLLVAAIGVGWAIAIDAASFAVSATLLLAIGHVPRAERSEPGAPFLRELRDGWREVTSRRWLWFVIVSATSFLMFYEAPLQVVGPLTMEAAYDGARSWGFALAAIGAGATLGAIISASGWLRRPMLTSIWLFFGCAVTPLLLLVEAPLTLICACNLLVGTSFGLFDTTWTAAVQRGVPEDKVARVSAWDWMGSLAGMPIGFALAGVLVDRLGRDVTLGVMSAATLVICVVFVSERSVRRIDVDIAPPAPRRG